MRILIDIGHPAHVNFFKNVISTLRNNGHDIFITAIRRGKLSKIIKSEFNEIPVRFNGKHRGTKWSILFEANILRFIEQLKFVYSKKIDIAVSCGSFTTGAIFKFVLRKPNIQFDDDPERKINVALEKMTSTELVFPPIVGINNKVKTMNALKEWAYLSPKYFTPSIQELDNYNLKPQRYVFIREVSTGSLNYANQQSNIIATFARDLPHNYKVLLSLEDKSTINQYPSDWILLKEPLNDIHSLIYFSKIVISSGDSMAREGAMLGVPSIYCGIREMAANRLMIDKGMLFHKDVEEVPQFVERIISSDIKIEEQDKFRERLEDEWVDVTEFIVSQIKKYG